MSDSTHDASAFPAPAPGAAPERPPRPAATIVVVRDGASGLEVLLSRRADGSDYTSGAWVFPGGIVDARDRDAHGFCTGVDDAGASAKLGLESGGLDFFVAAIRECFEESGLLFGRADDDGGSALDGAAATRLAPWRGLLHQREHGIAEMCAKEKIRLDAGAMVYLSHWLTPLGRAKRYDTRFFIAAAPASQIALFDGTEMVEQLWIAPGEALARSKTLKLLTPTQKTLELIARYADVASLMAWAAAPRSVPLTMPHVAIGKEGPRPVLPDEPAWAELGRIDPAGHGHGSYELVAGRAVRLSERVIRVTAGNGSMMTGPGTNTYLIGGGAANEWAVIDPGPAIDAHVEAILAAAPGPIRRIFATHTHTDHSPATVALKARTGARVHGLAARHREWQDATFVPDVTLTGGERIELAPATTLLVIHTPGHASNHLCYLLEEEKTLFTGDHVMQMSTVVINPPDGDMRAYIESLRSLLDLDLDWLGPGHGFLMAEPRQAMEKVIAHRLAREAKVSAALQALQPAAPDALLAQVYADVPARLHMMAMRSLTAHLLKLRDDGLARLDAAGRWSSAAAG
jgi:glyoxylase-like metal-dependent hydrolase (beta-lactamase superfamily II)/8-oxo-dGTP pyrophosphatase MutT (NUDIX family)